MNTYVFGYYLENDNGHYNIFVDNQKDLDIATEALAELLEKNPDSFFAKDLDLINKYK